MFDSFNGILNLDKPAGISSAALVNRVKWLLPRGVKIGHAGTLDPFATGVLLLLVGKATRRCESLMNLPKQYDATVKLGATTPTDDPTSPETLTPGFSDADVTFPAIEQIELATKKYIGHIPQRPPPFSALRVGGKRAYTLAREGRPPELPPRVVRVDNIEILQYVPPLLKLRIDCGRGVYIRSIARDLGQHLTTGGYLIELRRTRVGPYQASNGVTLEQLTKEGVQPHLQPLPAEANPTNPSTDDQARQTESPAESKGRP
jgi:tRNA pseudouridine55 synthase